MKTAAVTILMLSAMAAAGHSQPRRETADWYIAHPSKTASAREWCHDHPTEQDAAFRSGDRTCLYVEQAYARQLERQLPR